MSKRIHIVLPEETVQTIDRMAIAGNAAAASTQPSSPTVANLSVEALKEQLERAAVRDRDLDREVAGDWFAVDPEA
jgi:CopG family transcriptional regulator/antitoxin EndoAI